MGMSVVGSCLSPRGFSPNSQVLLSPQKLTLQLQNDKETVMSRHSAKARHKFPLTDFIAQPTARLALRALNISIY